MWISTAYPMSQNPTANLNRWASLKHRAVVPFPVWWPGRGRGEEMVPCEWLVHVLTHAVPFAQVELCTQA